MDKNIMSDKKELKKLRKLFKKLKDLERRYDTRYRQDMVFWSHLSSIIDKAQLIVD